MGRLWRAFQMAANKVVQLLWFIPFFLCIIFLIMSFEYGIQGSFSIDGPESFHFEKLYLALFEAYFFLFLLVSILLVICAKKLEKKQKGKPSERYLGMRVKAMRYALIVKESGRTFIEELCFYTKQSLASGLDGSDEDEQQNLLEAKGMLEDFYGDMVLNGNVETQQMAIRAITFTIKSKVIKYPSDVQGKRRAHFLIKLLSEISDSTSCHHLKTIGSYLSSCFKAICSYVSSCFSSCFSSSSQITKYSWTTIILTAATTFSLTIAPYVLDIYTDAKLVYNYWNLQSSSDSSLIFLITGYSPKAYSDSELIVSIGYLSFFLLLSMMLIAFANLPKKLAGYYKVQVKMESPEVERSGEILSPSSVIQRHDVAVEESSFECPYQFMWQFGIYFSIVPLLHAVPADIFFLENLDDYDKILRFYPDFLISAILTVFSLTRAQVKTNGIFEEYNMTWKQSIVYHLASFGSTVSFLFVITSTVSNGLGWSYNSALDIADSNTIITNIVLFTFGILSVAPSVSRFIRFIQHTTHFSASALCRALGQTCSGSTKPDSRFPAPSLSWVFSTFTPFLLPTSQHISDGCYNFYHSTITQSPQLLFQMAAQCLTYFYFIGFMLLFSSPNFGVWSIMRLSSNYSINSLNYLNISIVDVARYEATNGTYLKPQSALSEAVRNTYVATVVAIPIGFIVSYIFLFIYFNLDDGFYSNVNMDYWFHNDDANNGDNNDEVVENAGGNIEVTVDPGHNSAVGTEEDPSTVHDLIEKDKLDDPEKNSCSDWLQSWIDRDVEDDCCAGRKIKACGKSPAPFKDWDMSGSWIDLTGDDGLEGECEEGAAVANCQEGTLAYHVKMTFPFFRNEKEEAEVVVETQV